MIVQISAASRSPAVSSSPEATYPLYEVSLTQAALAAAGIAKNRPLAASAARVPAC